MLRDKLHHLSSQLADAQERVREVEESERGRLIEVLVSLKKEDGCQVELGPNFCLFVVDGSFTVTLNL
jgi:hypothetical protein